MVRVSFAAVIIVVIVAFAFFILPLSPTLRLSFQITTPTNYSGPPTLEILDASYAKFSLYATAKDTKGNIALTYLGATQGNYVLSIAISYNNNPVSTGGFSNLGDGVYSMYVAYLPQFGEQPSIPYFVTLTLYYSNGIAVGSQTRTIYPT
jgi:hypothetical protein